MSLGTVVVAQPSSSVSTVRIFEKFHSTKFLRDFTRFVRVYANHTHRDAEHFSLSVSLIFLRIFLSNATDEFRLSNPLLRRGLETFRGKAAAAAAGAWQRGRSKGRSSDT